MKIFKINDNLSVVCEWKKTKMAFKHEATLMENGLDVETVKVCYQNRTWESYEFQSVLYHLCEKTKHLTKEEKEVFTEKIKNEFKEENEKEVSQKFGAIAMVAKMGDFFGKTDKEKNDWKTRIIKAGLESQGLIMPENWDKLSEGEKSSRLDGAIGALV